MTCLHRISLLYSCSILLCIYLQHVTTETIDVCIEDETVNYLNRRDVQSALHARLVGVRRWDVCSK